MKIQAAIAREKGQIAIETVQLEEPRDNEILVRNVATGICHTDLSVLEQVLPAPLPMALGHEGAGVVVKVGAKVTKVAPGDHVLMSYDYCGHYAMTATSSKCAKTRRWNCSDHWVAAFKPARALS